MDLASVLTEPLTAADLRTRLAERQRRLTQGRGPTERAALLRRHSPEAVDQLLAQAEAYQRGLMVLPGTGGKPVHVGTPPRWHTNPTTDEEYTWGLNRMGHWPVLLRAYALTGEHRFAAQVTTELTDWIEQCPRPAINTEREAAYRAFYQADPWRSLEAGIRLYETWPWIVAHLADNDLLTPDLVARLAVSIHEHAEVLAEICPVFWPRADHNHYLMENLGLLSAAAMMPELAGAARWRVRALRELERCAIAQMTEDGGQIEGCAGYHNGCVYWLCFALRLAKQSGAAFSPAYNTRLRRSLDYTVHTVRPTGIGVPWGDSDATDSATAAAIWWREASGDSAPLHALLPLVGSDRARTVALDHFWVVDDPEALLAELDKPSTATPPLVNWQRELSQVALRTDWNRDALSVFFACRSPANNGHAHLDTGSFDFCALGRNLVADPGRYTYRECPERYLIKCAAWHSTITVDGRDPFAYLSRWTFGKQHEGRIVNVWERPGLLAAASLQHNFAPAIHRRLVALLDGRALLVLDDFDGLASASAVQRWFHIDSTDIRWNEKEQRAVAACDDVTLHLLDAVLEGRTTGSCQPGHISDQFDSWHDSTRLCLEDVGPGSDKRAYAALLLPHHRYVQPASVTGFALTRTADGLRLTVTLDDRPRILTWTAEDIIVGPQ